MENYLGFGYIYPNWNEGTSKTVKTMLFDEKLQEILSKSLELGVECGLKNGDVICIASPSNWEFQTYHECLKDFDGLYVSKQLANISRIAVCKNLVAAYERLKRPIKANKSQTLIFDNGRLVPLYEKGESWLSKKVAIKAVSEVARIRGIEKIFNPKVVEIKIATRTSEIKHIAWSFESSAGDKFYCLFNSGYIFSNKTDKVFEEKILKIEERKVISDDFISYVLPIGEKNCIFTFQNMEDGIRSQLDKVSI